MLKYNVHNVFLLNYIKNDKYIDHRNKGALVVLNMCYFCPT